MNGATGEGERETERERGREKINRAERDWNGETDPQTGATTEKDVRRNIIEMVGECIGCV